MERAVPRLNGAGKLNYMELSIAAKAYFLLEQRGQPADAADLVRLAHQFGRKVTEDEVERAVQFPGGLELAALEILAWSASRLKASFVAGALA